MGTALALKQFNVGLLTAQRRKPRTRRARNTARPAPEPARLAFCPPSVSASVGKRGALTELSNSRGGVPRTSEMILRGKGN
jgi:hypothetical protein